MIVLGIDVGIRVCGYVICRVRNLDLEIIKEAEIKPCVRKSLPERLNHIFENLEKEVDVYRPQVIAVETLYSHHRHPTTLGVLAHVRGVIALLAFRRGVEFREYLPTRARKSFMGRGSADSSRVKKMAENVTGKTFKSIHTADAFSLVAAFSHEQKIEKLGLRKT